MSGLLLTKGTGECGFSSLDKWAPLCFTLELDRFCHQPLIHGPLQGQANYCQAKRSPENPFPGAEPPLREQVRLSSEERVTDKEASSVSVA